MKVTVMDANGKELKVFTVKDTVTDGTLKSWKRTKSDKIKLKFELRESKLFSFSFSD